MMRDRIHAAALIISMFWCAGFTGAQQPAAKPMEPTAARMAFKLEAGLKIELAAAEPFVRSPAAFGWDDSNRLFVAENTDYPTGPPPGNPPAGAVVELRDIDQDGVADQRIEFATGLRFPNGLMPWRGGWLVTDAPNLYWLSDTNADGRADVREIWFTGFATNQSTQLRACYPTLGPDGWIYIARGLSGGVVQSPKWTNLPPVDLKGGDFRFRTDGSAAEAIGGNAQFGMVLDDLGRRFLTSNRNPIMHAVASPHWWKRMDRFYFSEITQDISPVGGDAKVFPISADLTTSGFMPELMSAPHAGSFTSACGLHQFFGEGLPAEFQGSWFICEPAQNLVQRQIPEADGPTFRTRRATEGKDFLASPDTWFHPVFAATGPDGALYLADMYRNFIDHPEYLPKDARAKIDFDSGKQLGRIWKITSSQRQPRVPTPALAKASAEELARAFTSDNIWIRQTAHRLLIEREDPSPFPHLLSEVSRYTPAPDSLETAIKKWATERLAVDPLAGSHLGRARIVQLFGDILLRKKKLFNPALRNALSHALLRTTYDPSPSVRESAFRVFQLTSDSHNPLPDIGSEFLRLWVDDPSPAVRFHVAYSLGQGDYNRMTEALVNILRRDAASRWTRAVVFSGLKERMNEFAEKWFATEWTELGGAPVPPIGFDDSGPMITTAYEMGRVYGAPSANGGGILLHRALDPAADGTGWQAALLAGWLQTARPQAQSIRANVPLLSRAGAKLAEDELEARLLAIAEQNARTALNPSAGVAKRSASVRLLGEIPCAAGDNAVLAIVTRPQPKDLQLAAARAVTKSLNMGVAERLLAEWRSFSPELREVFVDVLVSKPELALALLKAVEKEEIPAWSINANRKKTLLNNANPEVKKRAEQVLGKLGTDRQKVFEDYKPVLQLKAETGNGRSIFLKHCAACHQHHGAGFNVGPDLAGVKNQPREALLYHILVPDAEIYPGFQNYDVETVTGETLSGLLVQESDTLITLQRALGEKDVIARERIGRIRSSSSSLMPNELEKAMTRQELADLLGFLGAQ